MKTVQGVAELKAAVAQCKKPVGFVPTMGALHRGHMSLVEKCREECGAVVVSIFVNPTQFNDKNDLENYPRTLENDLRMLENAGADIIFAPGITDIYPEPDTRVFDFGQLDKVMEGARRPGHFNGVGQVVSRLFDIVAPDRAYFGEKDFQQLAVIRELVRLGGYGVEIVACPTVREEDGLAMSSRNMLLSPEKRAAAPVIYRTLTKAAEMAAEGRDPGEIKSWATETINRGGDLQVEYFEIADPDTLQPLDGPATAGRAIGFIAVKAGNVRLIDNIKF